MKYIKLFENHSNYEDFVSGGTMVKPNVSHCVQENEVHYNSLIDKVLVVKYVSGVDILTKGADLNIVQLYYYSNTDDAPFKVLGSDMFSKVEIDGVEVSVSDLDVSEGKYRYLSDGEHTVAYTLKDPTFIGAEIDGEAPNQTITKLGALFVACNNIVSVEIPNSVTSIGAMAFCRCSALTSITIPDSVTSIGDGAFYSCSGLANATIPDSVTTIGDEAFCLTNLDATSRAKILAINSNGICKQSPR